MPDFIPGLKLSELFYHEVIKDILQEYYPNLVFAAARIGSGSDVLGFDTPQSRDHDWGPRVEVFLAEADYHLKEALDSLFSEKLPRLFRGYATNFSERGTDGSNALVEADEGPIRHEVIITTVERYSREYLGLIDPENIENADWLIIPQQKLRTLVSGSVFHDGSGTLSNLRERLRYYPADIWYFLLSAQWSRIWQEEPFMARCGDVGDETGSIIVAARQAREIMKLCFLMERQYAPYNKWFGTAFARLNCAAELSPLLEKGIQSSGWREREKYLSQCYSYIARMHNALEITPPLPTEVTPFWARPYQVLHSELFFEALKERIVDPAVKALIISGPRGVIGGIDQYIDSTDILSQPSQCLKLRVIA